MKTLPLLFLLLASGACDDVKYISKRNSGRTEQLLSSSLPSRASVRPLSSLWNSPLTDAPLLFFAVACFNVSLFPNACYFTKSKEPSLSRASPLPPGLPACCFSCTASCSSALLWPSRTAMALLPSPPPLPVGTPPALLLMLRWFVSADGRPADGLLCLINLFFVALTAEGFDRAVDAWRAVSIAPCTGLRSLLRRRSFVSSPSHRFARGSLLDSSSAMIPGIVVLHFCRVPKVMKTQTKKNK